VKIAELDPKLKETFLNHLRSGMTPSAAASAIGMSIDFIRRYHYSELYNGKPFGESVREIVVDAEMKLIESFDDARKAEYLDLLQLGYTETTAAEKLGYSIRHVRAHYQDPYPHEWSETKFIDAVKEAEESKSGKVEMSLFKKAIEGDTKAQITWLTNRCPERWRDAKSVQLSGDSKNPMRVEFSGSEIIRKMYREYMESLEPTSCQADTDESGYSSGRST